MDLGKLIDRHIRRNRQSSISSLFSKFLMDVIYSDLWFITPILFQNGRFLLQQDMTIQNETQRYKDAISTCICTCLICLLFLRTILHTIFGSSNVHQYSTGTRFARVLKFLLYKPFMSKYTEAAFIDSKMFDDAAKKCTFTFPYAQDGLYISVIKVFLYYVLLLSPVNLFFIPIFFRLLLCCILQSALMNMFPFILFRHCIVPVLIESAFYIFSHEINYFFAFLYSYYDVITCLSQLVYLPYKIKYNSASTLPYFGRSLDCLVYSHLLCFPLWITEYICCGRLLSLSFNCASHFE